MKTDGCVIIKLRCDPPAFKGEELSKSLGELSDVPKVCAVYKPISTFEFK